LRNTFYDNEWLTRLLNGGYKILSYGGSGFILPKSIRMVRPTGETFYICKMQGFKEESLKMASIQTSGQTNAGVGDIDGQAKQA